MQTPIGQALKSGGPGLWGTTVVSVAVVGCYIAIVAVGHFALVAQFGLAAAVLISSGTVALCRRDEASFGFRLSPLQGWAYWTKVAILLGVVFLIVLLAFAVVLFGVLGYSIPSSYFYLSHRSQIWPLFVSMCLVAPTNEEVIFRLAICPPMIAWSGPKASIAASGVTFAAVHVLAGNPSADNLLAGFVLAWAFLKSGTLAVPMALHFLGNLCAFAYQVSCLYSPW